MIAKTLRLNDRELLTEVRAKSRAGAEALFDYYSKALMLAIIRVVPDIATANKVLYDTYQCAWQTIESYHEDDSTLLAWMMTIARKQALISCEPNNLL